MCDHSKAWKISAADFDGFNVGEWYCPACKAIVDKPQPTSDIVTFQKEELLKKVDKLERDLKNFQVNMQDVLVWLKRL